MPDVTTSVIELNSSTATVQPDQSGSALAIHSGTTLLSPIKVASPISVLVDSESDLASSCAPPRIRSFRWMLVNEVDGVIGELHPVIGASMSNNTQGAIFRTVNGFRLTNSEWQDINVFREYVRPYAIAIDDAVYPLGRLAFASNPKTEGQGTAESSLVDQRLILDQPMTRAYGLTNGDLIYSKMVEVAEIYGFPRVDCKISDAGQTVGGGPVSWPPDTKGLEILTSLCQRSGFHPPYFSNSGILTMRPPIALGLGVGHVYDRDRGLIRRETLTTNENLLSAPNVYRVISSGGSGKDISAEVSVDPTLPHSVENRRFRVVEVVRRTGLKDQRACQLLAEAFARDSSGHFETRAFDSDVNPCHDTFAIVEMDGTAYREISWDMEMSPGGAMNHSLTRDAVVTEE